MSEKRVRTTKPILDRTIIINRDSNIISILITCVFKILIHDSYSALRVLLLLLLYGFWHVPNRYSIFVSFFSHSIRTHSVEKPAVVRKAFTAIYCFYRDGVAGRQDRFVFRRSVADACVRPVMGFRSVKVYFHMSVTGPRSPTGQVKLKINYR